MMNRVAQGVRLHSLIAQEVGYVFVYLRWLRVRALPSLAPQLSLLDAGTHAPTNVPSDNRKSRTHKLIPRPNH